MAVYAIGDVQGCYDELRRLLDLVAFDERQDRLWFVGDLVNRGPQSLEVLRFIKSLGTAATTVLGNHDLHLIVTAAGHGRPHAEDTLEAVLSAPDRDELIDWLRACPLLHVEGDHVLVHAGLLPAWPVEFAARLADEVHGALVAENHDDFLAHLWGSEPDAWRDDMQGWDRLRVIVNAMTRLRFCSASGRMALASKGPPGSAPSGTLPWFAVPGRASMTHTVVFGHWSALGLHLEDGLAGLDTGCLWGGSLTALRLEDRRLFQVPCSRKIEPRGWD